MNWYRAAQTHIQNFEDRNIWNDKIDDLKKITIALDKMAKLVYQSGSVTKTMLKEVLDSKRLTSYPVIHNLLVTADTVALDSPHKFSALCKAAASEVVMRIKKLESERKQFSQKELPAHAGRWKGWKAND